MPRIHMIRHGRAASLGDANLDPALDAVGLAQAEAMAEAMAPLGPLPIIVSPLRRTRETAAALERTWGVQARVEPRIAEIPFPVATLPERAAWLRQIMPGRWTDLGPGLQQWRANLLDLMMGLTEDRVVVTHFVSLNMAVGHATGDTRMTCFRPDNCARTIFDIEDGQMRLVTLGTEAETRIL